MIRPDVIITLPPIGNAGGQHHMASAVITRDAYKLAGDPTKYPEQIREGLRPWQPKKLYQSAGFGFPGEPPTPGRVTRVNSGVYDPLLGRTYAEIGSEARSMHKCQGMGQLLSLPAPMSQSTYQLVETTLPAQMQKDETTLFEGVDTGIMSLAKYATGRVPKDLNEGLTVISKSVEAARKAFDTVGDEATVKALLDGLFAARVLRRELRSMTIDEAGKFEIDFRLRQKEREFQQALVLASGLKTQALADDGVVVPGQPVKVNVIVANRGNSEVAIKQVKFDGFDPSTGSGPVPAGSQRDATCTMRSFTGGGFGFPGGGRGRGRGASAPPSVTMPSVRKDQVAHCEPTLTVPANARITEPYWHRKGEEGRYTFDDDAPFGLPYRPPPFYVQVTLGMPGGEEVISGMPVEYRYEGDIFSGEKRTELLVVPALSVRVSPQIAIIPASAIRSTPAPRTTQVQTPRGGDGRAGRGTPTPAAGRGRASARPVPPPSEPAPPPPSVSGAPTSAREVRVTVVNDTIGAVEPTVRLQVTEGWTVKPPEQKVKLDRADESKTVRFTLEPSSRTNTGEFHVRATAT